MRKYSTILLFLTLLVFALLVLKLQKENELLKKEKLPQISSSIKRDPSHMWGQPAKLMFPDITNPKYIPNNKVDFLEDNDDVYFFRSENSIYVYPVLILSFHHIINDVINGKPVAVTLCLLSDSALVYSRKIDDRTLNFGVLGPLYYGNLVMYDKETDSYWFQLTGEAFKGQQKDKRLTQVAALQKTIWKNFKNDKNVKVLSPVKDIEFYKNFYKKYNSSSIGVNSLKGKKGLDKRLPELTKGLGINVGEKTEFYTLNYIRNNRVINANVDGWNILFLYDKRYDSYEIYRRFINNRILNFKIDGEYLIDTETNSKWNFDAVLIEGKLKGEKLTSPIYTEVYWFSWSAFFPGSIYYR